MYSKSDCQQQNMEWLMNWEHGVVCEYFSSFIQMLTRGGNEEYKRVFNLWFLLGMV